MWSDRTFCQFFLRRETRKLTANIMFAFSSSISMDTLPTATERHRTFFIWNLMVRLTVSTFSSMDSWWDREVGNLPALLRPGPEWERARYLDKLTRTIVLLQIRGFLIMVIICVVGFGGGSILTRIHSETPKVPSSENKVQKTEF